MLEAPPTIRVPRSDEIPGRGRLDVLERIKQREQAKIVEGFVLKNNSTHQLPFRFYAEININNLRLWNLFEALSTLLPKEVCCIYNSYEEEPVYSSYFDKTFLLEILSEFNLELTQDCSIEIGLLFHSEESLNEVFIKHSKYIQYWGIDETGFRRVMDDLGLSEIPDLSFIDEFPNVIEPLTMFNASVRPTETIISELNALLAK